jgi:hypothetical protein
MEKRWEVGTPKRIAAPDQENTGPAGGGARGAQDVPRR